MATQDLGVYVPAVRQNGVRLKASEPLVVASPATFTGVVTTPALTIANTPVNKYPVSAAVNATATVTAAQLVTGYLTSTSAAPVTMTLPTGTLLGAALGAAAGTVFEFYVDNTAGANTVTIAVAVNGILSAAAVAGSAAGAGLLTVPSGVTGLAQFTAVFTSATAYVFSRTA